MAMGSLAKPVTVMGFFFRRAFVFVKNSISV